MNNIIISNKKPIVIGRQGENQVTTIKFSIDALFPHIQNATYGLVHKRHGDAAPYPVATMAIGGYVNWVINSADVGNVGNGTAQLTAYKDGAVAKSIIFTTITLTSMGMTDAPDPIQSYIDRIVRAGQEAVNAAADAEESAEEAAGSAEAAAGSAEAASGSAEAAAGSAEAASGSAEEAAASATQAGLRANSAEASRNQAMTYANNAYNSATQAGISAQSAAQARTAAEAAASSARQILDDIPDTVEAELAAAKQSGEFDGADGYSPTVAITDITGGHRVTITDKNGSHSFDVMDGQGGSGGSSNVLGGYNVSIELIQISDGAGGWIDAYYVDASSVPGVQVGDWIVGNNNPGLAMFRVEGFDSGDPYGTSLVILRRDIIPAGGTTGQVLRKKSNSDYDVEWATI